MTRDTIIRIIGAVVALALLGAGTWFWTHDGRDQSAGLITAALGLVALVVRSPLEGRPPGGGAAGGGAALALLFVFGHTLAGCGASALGVQADLVALGGIAAAGADEVLLAARARDLDAVVEEARTECGAAECGPDRAEYYRAELAARELRWDPVLECRAPLPEALRAWADGIEVAHQASESVGAELLSRLISRFRSAWASVTGCVERKAPQPVDLGELSPLLTGRVPS